MIQLSGQILRSSAGFQRPGNATAYAANDVVCDSTSAPTLLIFPGTGRLVEKDLGTQINPGGYIVKATIKTNQKTNVAQFRLHLYHTAITPINDNAAFTLLWANNGKRIGAINFSALTTEDSSGSTMASNMVTVGSGNLPLAIYQTTTNNTTLYGVLETLTAFTPDSGQAFEVALTIDSY